MRNSDAGGQAVEVRNLTKSYGSVQAVQDVSFEIARGEVLAASRAHPTVAELAGALHLSPGTVRNHVCEPRGFI